MRLDVTIARITFRNEENLYTVARATLNGSQGDRAPRFERTVTVVGSFAFVAAGERMILEGDWVSHPTYGTQFRVDSYESVPPTSVEGLERYLGSGLIRGVGPATARKLVRAFGSEALKVIEEQPERLLEIDGIGPARRDVIVSGLASQQGVRNVMLFLASHGVSPSFAYRIYRHYRSRAIDVVRKDPYRLADEVHGIGFKSADKIAAQLGISRDSPERVRAGIRFVLWQAGEQGHVCLPVDVVVEQAGLLLGLDAHRVGSVLADCSRAGDVTCKPDSRRERTYVYLPSFHRDEEQVVRSMRALVGSSPLGKPPVPEHETRYLNAGQRQALAVASASRLMVLTGGPGTGKTTTVRAMAEMFERAGLSVALAAPTGRAARRMAEACARQASTLHRLLEVGPAKTGNGREGEGREGLPPRFNRNQDNPIEADVVIVDEASMIDMHMMGCLLAALPAGARLVLVGDSDQLPSVGPGSVLADVVSSGAVPVQELTEIFRQARQSWIVLNAHRVRDGRFPVLPERASTARAPSARSTGGGMAQQAAARLKACLLGDFCFMDEESPEAAADTILWLVREGIPSAMGLDPIDDIQVLSPMHRGCLGVLALNQRLQDALNPARASDSHGAAQVRYGSSVLRVGDKVMQLRNDYEKEVMNGEVGRVVWIDPDGAEVVVAFQDGQARRVSYARDELDELASAYAISVHKSQGSEYPAVVMPVSTQHYVMLQRNLLYTAMTRARKLLALVGSRKALALAVRNAGAQVRYSLLRDELSSLPR